jgi:hypothetical protein
MREELEDTKEITRIRILKKNRQHNNQKKKDKRDRQYNGQQDTKEVIRRHTIEDGQKIQ